jgi:hypothetical protein
MKAVSVGRIALTVVLFCASAAAGAPSGNVHSLDWRVHVDLIDVPAGRDLAFFTQLINDRHAQANAALQGHQGPFDSGCCTELDAVTVTTFGTPGDGLDVVTTVGEFNAVIANGNHPYLIQTLAYCDGAGPAAGCAATPGDYLIVAFDSEDSGFLAEVIAHERGHNAGLIHVSANACQLMQAFNAGGCLTVDECNSYIAKADTVSGTCDCLANTVGDPPVAAGTSCGTGDICSEGLCGDALSSAGAEMLVAGGPGASTGETADDWLLQSALAGGWNTPGAAGAEISGLAWDPANEVLYGIEVLAGDDALVTLDPDTGAVLTTIGTLSGKEVASALAFDPRAGGDRLYGVEIDDDIFGGTSCSDLGPITPPCFSEVFEIDPSDASISVLGELNGLIVDEGVTGLAWDDVGEVLYASTLAGLYEIDVSSCNGSTCPSTQVDNVFRRNSALTFETLTGRVLREGDTSFGQLLFDVVDPVTGDSEESIGIDPFTAGGLAVREVPEPGGTIGLIAGAAALALLRRRRVAADA